MIIDMPDSEYFSGEFFGIHAIKDLDTYGPRGFFNRHMDNSFSSFGDKSAFNVGTATHERVLRGVKAYEQRVVFPPAQYEGPKGEMKKWNYAAKVCKQWKIDHKDKLVLTQAEDEMIRAMYDAVFETPEAASYLKMGHPEVGFRTEISGVPVQCKADFISTEKSGKITAVIDLKTCVSLKDFKRDFHKYGYGRQASHYSRVISMELGRRVPFIFIAVEKNNPHRCELFQIDDDYLMEGDVANKKSYELLGAYLKSHGHRKPWPLSVDRQEVQTIQKPSYL